MGEKLQVSEEVTEWDNKQRGQHDVDKCHQQNRAKRGTASSVCAKIRKYQEWYYGGSSHLLCNRYEWYFSDMLVHSYVQHGEQTRI